MAIPPNTFQDWHRLPGASENVVARIALELGPTLPPQYLELLRYMNGGEGFLAEAYVRFYPCEQLALLNQAYAIAEWLPDHVLIGSDGGGTAVLLAPDGAVVEVPFIPMDARYVTRRTPDFAAFLRPTPPGTSHPTPNPAYLGKEIHEVQPVLFGGDPCDPANKVALTPEQHAPLVVWWNRKFRETASSAS